MIIETTSPYDFHLTASVFTRFPTQVADYFVNGGYRRILRENGQLYLIEVKCSGCVDSPTLDAHVLYPESAILSGKMIDCMRWILGMDFDLKPFYDLMDREQETRILKETLYGLKPPRSPSIFEALVIAITEQQLSLAVAISLRERLARRYGDKIHYKGFEYLEFPRPEVLAEADVEDIQSLGINRRKATTIREVAELATSKKIDLDSIYNQPTEKTSENLIKIKGIGPWTIEYMLCRGAGRYEVVPVGDHALQAGLKKWYGNEKIKSEDDVRRILDRFGKYSGYAAFYFIFSYAYDRYPPRLL